MQETPPPSSGSNLPAPAAKKVSTVKDTEKKSKGTLKMGSTSVKVEEEEVDPTTVPLPNSRSASPFPPTSNGKAGTPGPHPLRASFLPAEGSNSSLSVPVPHASSSTSTSALPSTFSPSPSPYSSSSGYSSSSRSKRTHEESSGECEEGSDVGSVSKRSRRSSPAAGVVAAVVSTLSHRGGEEERMDVDGGDGTPALSSGVSTASSSDVASSPEPEPEPERVAVLVRERGMGKGPLRQRKQLGLPQPSIERRLTRRQRKQLGMPKPNKMLGGDEGGSVGRIVIPGGRFSRGVEVKVEEGEVEGDAEWRKNGSGRLDVRGFRELKI